MRDSPEICARCAWLKTEGYPEQFKQGQGYCLGHGNDSPSRPPFANWNDGACVLFIAAKAMAPRERWIEKRQAEERDKELQLETKG